MVILLNNPRIAQLEELILNPLIKLSGFSIDFVENGFILSVIIIFEDERGDVKQSKTFIFEEDVLIDEVIEILLDKYKIAR